MFCADGGAPRVAGKSASKQLPQAASLYRNGSRARTPKSVEANAPEQYRLFNTALSRTTLALLGTSQPRELCIQGGDRSGGRRYGRRCRRDDLLRSGR